MTDSNAELRRKALHVAASVLAQEVSNRKVRFAPSEVEAHQITLEMDQIAARLHEYGAALEGERGRNHRRRQKRRQEGRR